MHLANSGWISSDPVDVENWANLMIGFEDGSHGTMVVSDVGLGGLNTRVTAFMTDGVIKANMTSNDAIETYAPDPSAFSGEYFTEKLETKAGWNRPSCDEDWFRGFAQEIGGFRGRDPRGPGIALRHRSRRGMRKSDLRGVPVCRDGQPGDHGLMLLEGSPMPSTRPQGLSPETGPMPFVVTANA